jgi:hypothetical protein
MSNQEQSENYGVSLYYPHIHIRNIDWLKCTLLYWDVIRRIVPDNFPPDEEDEARQDILSAIKAGLLIRTDTSKYIERARDIFFECAWQFKGAHKQPGFNIVDALGADVNDPDSLGDSSVVSHVGTEGSGSRESVALKGLLERLKVDSDPVEVDIWNSKMHDQIRDLFEEAGLAHTVKGGSYMMVQRAAADLHMACLATAMKEAIGSPLVTDSNACDQIGKFLDYGRLSPDPNRLGTLFELNIPYPRPEALHDVSMSDILDFHDKTMSERRNFRRAVDKIVTKARSVQEIDEYRYADFLRDESREIKDAMESHRSKMQTLGIKSFTSLLKIGAPTAITSAISAVGSLSSVSAINPLSAGILVGTGVTMSLIAWWAEVRGQRREEIEKNPWHYVLSLEKRFL